jgi:hypothetical protein
MQDDTRARLTALFTDHTSAVDAAAQKRVSRDLDEKRVEEQFREAFAAHCTNVILPLLEDFKREIFENGHGATVASTTHGKFFSGPDNALGVVFMFYPGTVASGDYAFKPDTSHLAVFGVASRQEVQIYSKAEIRGGFTPGKLPDVFPLADVTVELLSAKCLDIIGDTLHRLQPRKRPETRIVQPAQTERGLAAQMVSREDF